MINKNKQNIFIEIILILVIGITASRILASTDDVKLQIKPSKSELNFSLVGQYDTPGYDQGFTVAGKYAYIADGAFLVNGSYVGSLQVIDISKPSSPVLAGSYLDASYGLSRAYPLRVEVVGNHAYVASGFGGLRIIDVKNPSSMSLIGTYSAGINWDVAIHGRYAYVVTSVSGGNIGENALHIVDITNPAVPVLVGKYTNFSNWPCEVEVAWPYVYVAENWGDLRIINVKNPAAPVLAGIYKTNASANGLTVSGHYAYLTDRKVGTMSIIDVTNQSSPVLVGSFTGLPASTNNLPYHNMVTISGKYAYITTSFSVTDSDFYVLDISDPASPKLASIYTDTEHNDFRQTIIRGDYVYAIDAMGGLQIIKKL